jgi:hypothetical protein
MTKKKSGGKKRGPKGGIKHQPGQGHDPKSGAARKRRFARKVAKKRKETEEAARKQWEIWDALTEDQRKLLPNQKPSLPRPHDENENKPQR